MARPLSIDLRERAVAAVLKGGLSRHRAATQFGVAASTVINWVRRFQETGSVAPLKMGGSNASGLDRLGALERRAGETAVDVGAQRRPRRNKLKNIDAEMNV